MYSSDVSIRHYRILFLSHSSWYTVYSSGLSIPHSLSLIPAGIYGLTGCGQGPTWHLSHLSYAGREVIARSLNGQPNVFHSFCHALGVENRLLQTASKSRNPTAYLIQEYSERPEATFDRLEQALVQIGKRDLFERLMHAVETDS